VGRALERRGVLAAVFVLHAAVTLWTALHHEAWSDEGDPWLLMRDASASEMLLSAANGGVPLLFHVTLLPFARMGLPYLAMQLLNLVYVWAAVALVLRSRAFSAPVKILFPFSYFPAFELAAIPRPYGLQMLLTFAMAEAWRERDSRPVRLGTIVALLANTSSQGLLTAAFAGILLLWERFRSGLLRERRIVASMGLMILGGLVAAAQLWPREGRQAVYTWVSADTVWYALASTFFPDGRVEDFVVPAVLVLGIVTYGISRRALPVLFLWLVGTTLVLIYVFVWMGGLRHAGLLLVLVLSAVWIADAYGPYRRERLLMAALAVSLAYSVVPAARSWVAETRYAFSGSREVAAFLERERLDREAVLASDVFWTAPLVYLPEARLWQPAAGRYGTFARWERRDYELLKVPRETVLRLAERQLQGRRWVFLTHGKLPASEQKRYRLLFETRVRIWRMNGEHYRVYEPVGSP
jgi:hypothetical protein